MSGFTDQQLAAGMRRLRGQICTLSYERPLAEAVKERGLMRFEEWPSGHWRITERGHAFLLEQPS